MQQLLIKPINLPNQATNAVILYNTGSEQLRKCYDNFGERRDVSNKDRQR